MQVFRFPQQGENERSAELRISLLEARGDIGVISGGVTSPRIVPGALAKVVDGSAHAICILLEKKGYTINKLTQFTLDSIVDRDS